MTNYELYRGKCKELSELAVKNNPELRLVRGFYYDHEWGQQAHWWTEDKDGVIHDPTKLQFPSQGNGFYEEFDGMCECEICGERMEEKDAMIVGNGNYAVCLNLCYGRLVM